LLAGLAGLATVGVALAVTLMDGARRPVDDAAKRAVAGDRRHLQLAPGERTRSTTTCDAEPTAVCVGDEVWRTDACGEPAQRIEDCGAGRCAAGTCLRAVAVDPFVGTCVGVSDLGSCVGDVVHTCLGGQVVEVDCAASDERCVLTGEGALCRSATDEDCDPLRFSPRCSGQTLTRCVDGQIQGTDCLALGAVCEGDRGPAPASCRVRGARPASTEADCGPCGCPAEASDEVCNGEDDDLDGYVDEAVSCSPVDVVAFLLTEGGELAHDRAAVEAELERVNATFAARPEQMASDEGGGPLRFRLADVVELPSSRWSGEVSDAAFFEMAADPVTHPPRESFYVPVVFADGFAVGEVPKSGASTLPHDTCGGVRRGPGQLPVGIIVVGRRRAPTTLAHELGHFLGLCHTHEGDPPVGESPALSEEGEACVEPCQRLGDGMCDTPDDPGPPVCIADPTCSTSCSDGSDPDPGNVMGYYPWCRTGFSTEQLRQIRRGLAHRRAWHRCRDAGCTCDPTRGDCPQGMGCYPFDAVPGSGIDEVAGVGPKWRCALDGQTALGGPCERHRDCSAGTVCASVEGRRRCGRPCRPGALGCDCLPGPDADGLGICREDVDQDAGTTD